MQVPRCYLAGGRPTHAPPHDHEPKDDSKFRGGCCLRCGAVPASGWSPLLAPRVRIVALLLSDGSLRLSLEGVSQWRRAIFLPIERARPFLEAFL